MMGWPIKASTRMGVLLASAFLNAPACTRPNVETNPPAQAGALNRADTEQTLRLIQKKSDWTSNNYKHTANGGYLIGNSCGGPCYNVIVATAHSREQADGLMS